MPPTPEEVALRARLDQARAQLQDTIAATRSHLEASRARLAPTREELEQLQREAASGRLGPDMRRLAGLVAAGRTSWLDVFDGSSPHAQLLAGHLAAMGERYAPAVLESLAADPPTGWPHDPDADPPRGPADGPGPR